MSTQSNKRVGLRVDEDFRQILDKMKQGRSVSYSTLIRKAVIFFYEHRKAEGLAD